MAEFSNFRPCSGQIRFSDYTYHVFLSFRGPDIRTSFVDHLFQAFKAAGIHAFLDTEKLQKGEIIGSSLEKAIQNSAILIPIFSKGYADSPWCLDEVRQMWQCRSTTNRLIIPLFYDVDPSDVRYAQKVNGKYAEAFNNHYSKGRFESQKIEEWKDALHEVSSLSGWSPRMTAGYEAKLVKQIVSDITALNCFPRPVLQIGLKTHSEKVKELLTLDQTDRTVRVGIWGIGGIGKTTLAEAIFNELCCTFEASCFLSDIRSAHERHGIIGLQTQMLKDLSKIEVKVNDINHGKSLLQFHLASIRSLVVLDNVDHWRQFDSFMLDFYGPGSRVIVTTRDRHILNSRMPPENIYELEGLREDEALELFSWHAFHKAKPDDAYRDLSTNIIQASGGVPLTLEVLGAFLLDKKDSDNCWKEALIMLENLSDPNIFEPLKISYDSLLPSEKEIFLDIACLFIGQDREEPSIFWKELGLYVDTALSNLQQKLLIKIDVDNKFRMHDLIRDLGRRIVADESPGNPGKRSRLWKQEDIEKVINEKQGTENVKYLLQEEEREEIRLKKNTLASMNGLRYLCFKDAIVKENDRSKLSPDLKWLKWKRCPLEVLPQQWNLEHLAILDVSSRSISHGSVLQFSLKQLWNEQSYKKIPKNLRVLRVNWCSNLQRLPTFSNLKSLFKLDLTGCGIITELPDSLGFQAQLYYMELSCCSRLEKLPDCIGNLSELKHLGLAKCSSLTALPYSIGCLQKLQYLNLSGCGKLEQLPSSITKLSCLQKLFISSCSSLNKLPDILEGLRSLKILELKHVFNISDLPHSIGSLTQLEKLDLESCLMVTLPPSVGHLKHLRSLNMNSCEFLSVIPDEIGGLESLEELILNSCENLTRIPSTISKFQSLMRFEAGYCDLRSIPESFGELSSLKILHLEHNKFSTLPLRSALLSPLTELVLCECTELRELPILPEGLVKLDIEGCKKLKIVPKVVHLKRIQVLRFTRCSSNLQFSVLWQIRALTTVQITFGEGSGETLRLTGADSWNERFRLDFQVMFEIEELKRELEFFTEKLKPFESEHLEDMKTMVESCRLEGSEAEPLEDLKRMLESGEAEGFKAENLEDSKKIVESGKAEGIKAEHLEDFRRMVEIGKAGVKAEHLEDLKRMGGGWEDFKRFSQAELSCYESLKKFLERLEGLPDNLTEVMGGLDKHMISLRQHLEDLKRMWGGWEDLKRISQAELSCYENLKTILERLKGLPDNFTEVMGGLEEHMLSLRSLNEAVVTCMRELRALVGSVKYSLILRRHRLQTWEW
ncbi:disease resistance protein RPV1 [Cryptomeria japonica]|uniref:disease resistance protein RPV1 n=1 Tax=Cryptomeria japonica TaxID=3369 RepID=UPI0025AC871D|nr:disease resistance protein RPV1 [Cryptomeria japonica]